MGIGRATLNAWRHITGYPPESLGRCHIDLRRALRRVARSTYRLDKGMLNGQHSSALTTHRVAVQSDGSVRVIETGTLNETLI